MKKFSPEATFAYAKLVNEFVATGATEEFNKAFEKFMDAYENSDDDGNCDELITTQRIVFDDTPVNKFREPKPGDVYVDDCGNRYLVDAVEKFLTIPCVVLRRLVGKHVAETRVMTLKGFTYGGFVKE